MTSPFRKTSLFPLHGHRRPRLYRALILRKDG